MCSRPASKYLKKFCNVSNQACISNAYEVVSCKPLCFFVTSKTNFMYLNSPCGCLHSDVSIEYEVTAPVSLTESVFMLTFHHLKNDSKSRQKHHWQSGIELSSQSRKTHPDITGKLFIGA